MDMLNKLSTLFQQALETREPSVDLLQSFVEHWKGITSYYLQNNDDSQPAKQTDIPWRLRQMLDILVYEEKQQEAVEETGVCMEYLVQHKLLETLCTLGKAQYPPGMNQQVLLFFSRLLAQIQKPLLHLINIHRPVQKLIGLCGLPASKHEKEEAQFLLVVCSRVKQDPYVLKYILKILDKSMPPAGTEASGQSENPVSPPSSPAQSDCCVSSSCAPPPGCSGLLQALVQLTGSQNGRVCLKAYESLLLLASLQAEGSGETLAHRTQMTALLAGRLCRLYSLLPLDTLDVLNLHNWPHAHWSSQFSQSCPEECLVFPGSDHMTRFFSWLDFLDHLMKEAPQVLAVKLAEAIHQYWLAGVLASHLTHMCEQRVLVSTVLLRCVLRQVQSPVLLDQLVLFLLGAPRAHEPEAPGDAHAHSLLLRRGTSRAAQPEEAGGGDVHTHCLRYHVVQNCDHISDEISMVTLGVFEELLLKPHRDILMNLLLRNLEQRRYITAPPAAAEESHSAEDNELSSFLDEDPFFSDDSFLPAPPEGQTQQAEGHTQAADIVNSFLCLVPVEVKSACLVQGAAYDTYIHDAHRMFQECSTVSESWGWQKSLPLSSSSSSSSSSGEDTSFYEGHFLKVLLDRLARLLEQPYELNLQLTSLLSRLASFNHPVLHEYLLDPYITLTPGARTLFSVLIRVIGELMDRVQRVSNLTDRLANVRKQLMGLQESNHAGEEFDTLLKGVIVLEEFCKELAAIAFVKIPADQD